MERNDIEARKLTLDDLMQVDEDGIEFWFARDLMSLLGYTKWQNFEVAIKRAMISADNAETPGQHHFAEISKMISTGKGAQRSVRDFKLTRYACYLVAMNGDTRKREIAFAQSYFALKTREGELIEQRMQELQRLTERNALSESERLLAGVAFERGVDSRGFATIKSKGDRALFGGYDTRAMKRRLGVSDRKPLADSLPSVTLAAKNLATAMTAHNAEGKDLHGENEIGHEHIENNEGVRKTLTSRGIYPENLPAEEDTKKLERRVRADERKLQRDARGFTREVGRTEIAD
ncbi:MAG: DNA damage-inducible protein D [Eggerthellaceae bacterium]|nr:DNA damage-inducible protein D [Eggerthellaceae bacterium]